MEVVLSQKVLSFGNSYAQDLSSGSSRARLALAPVDDTLSHPTAGISFRHYLIPNEKKKMNSFHFPSPPSSLTIAKLLQRKKTE